MFISISLFVRKRSKQYSIPSWLVYMQLLPSNIITLFCWPVRSYSLILVACYAGTQLDPINFCFAPSFDSYLRTYVCGQILSLNLLALLRSQSRSRSYVRTYVRIGRSRRTTTRRKKQHQHPPHETMLPISSAEMAELIE